MSLRDGNDIARWLQKISNAVDTLKRYNNRLKGAGNELQV